MKYNKKLKVDGIITAKNIEIIKKNSLTSVEPWGELNQGSDTDLDAATLNGKRPENFAKKVHTHNYLETTHNYDKSAHPDIIKLIEETENILDKPSIIKPQPNSIYAGEIIGTDIEYLTEKYNGAHLSTTWEISLNDKFTSLIYSSYNDTFNINKLMMGDYIKPNTIYYIRIKYQTEYFETPWSDIVKFKSQEKIVYAPTITFSDNFDVENDPKKVVIDFKDARVMDFSGVEAIDTMVKKYEEVGKTLTLRHLSKDCKNILTKAGPHCTYEEDDPTYKVAINY